LADIEAITGASSSMLQESRYSTSNLLMTPT
jgi:hypothetical protein